MLNVLLLVQSYISNNFKNVMDKLFKIMIAKVGCYLSWWRWLDEVYQQWWWLNVVGDDDNYREMVEKCYYGVSGR